MFPKYTGKQEILYRDYTICKKGLNMQIDTVTVPQYVFTCAQTQNLRENTLKTWKLWKERPS